MATIIPRTLTLAVGLPGSGKSTWFRNCGITPLSSDYLRLLLLEDEGAQNNNCMIHSTMQTLTTLRLATGAHFTYIDAVNYTRRDRAHYLAIAERFNITAKAIWFKTPLATCLRNNTERKRQVPEDVIKRMAQNFEPPTLEEGFTTIDEQVTQDLWRERNA